MIVYNTQDIIKKAKQLADLTNSDFISYNENFTLLNDAYTQLYQKAIDLGDNTYVKKMTLEPEYNSSYEGTNVRSYCLPCDFYQLRSVSQTNGIAGSLVPRKPKTGSELTRGYEIKNNRLLISGFDFFQIEVEYYPIPETLTIKAPDIILSKEDYPGFPGALYENHLIIYRIESEDGTNSVVFTCYDLRNGTSKEFTLRTVSKLTYGKVNVDAAQNGFTVSFTDEAAKRFCLINYNEDPGFKLVKENKIALRSILDDENTLSLENNDYGYTSYMFYEDTYWIIKDLVTSLEIIARDLPESNPESKEVYKVAFPSNKFISPKLVDYKDGMLVILDNYKLYYLNTITDELIEERHTPSYLVYSYGSKNYETGYGRLVNSKGERAIESPFNNTELDYPNNFYYTYLAYKLAIAYKCKQMADPSLLIAQLKDIEDAYYDTIERDANCNLRITNAY